MNLKRKATVVFGVGVVIVCHPRYRHLVVPSNPTAQHPPRTPPHYPTYFHFFAFFARGCRCPCPPSFKLLCFLTMVDFGLQNHSPPCFPFPFLFLGLRLRSARPGASLFVFSTPLRKPPSFSLPELLVATKDPPTPVGVFLFPLGLVAPDKGECSTASTWGPDVLTESGDNDSDVFFLTSGKNPLCQMGLLSSATLGL